MKNVLSILLRPFPIDIFKLKDFPETHSSKRLFILLLQIHCLIQYITMFLLVAHTSLEMSNFGVNTYTFTLVCYSIYAFFVAFCIEKFFFLMYIWRMYLGIASVFFSQEPADLWQVFGLVIGVVAVYAYWQVRKSLVLEKRCDEKRLLKITV